MPITSLLSLSLAPSLPSSLPPSLPFSFPPPLRPFLPSLPLINLASCGGSAIGAKECETEIGRSARKILESSSSYRISLPGESVARHHGLHEGAAGAGGRLSGDPRRLFSQPSLEDERAQDDSLTGKRNSGTDQHARKAVR